jgi:hypothetical protein
VLLGYVATFLLVVVYATLSLVEQFAVTGT